MVDLCKIQGSDDVQEIRFSNFPPGSVLALK